MPNWKYTLKLKDLLSHADLNEGELDELNQGVSERIESFLENNKGLDEGLRFDLIDLGQEFLLCESVEEFNCILSCVYDVCDKHRVWVK
jgi:hypothetical protein